MPKSDTPSTLKIILLSVILPIVLSAVAGIVSYNVAVKQMDGAVYTADSQVDTAKYTVDSEMLIQLMDQVQESQKQIQAQQVVIAQLQREILELRTIKGVDDYAATNFFENMPFPAWLKVYDNAKDEFIMHRINRAFEDEFHILNHQYEGKTDKEIWGEAQAKLFRENDLLVIRNLKSIIRTEVIDSAIDHESEETTWFIAKFPVRIRGKTYDAVGGVAIPKHLTPIADSSATVNLPILPN
jgi:hypothetical protein